MRAVPELRQAVARHSEKFNQLPVDWQTETLITVGATEAIAAVLMGVLNAGDEVMTLTVRCAVLPLKSARLACTASSGYLPCLAVPCAMTSLPVCGTVAFARSIERLA